MATICSRWGERGVKRLTPLVKILYAYSLRQWFAKTAPDGAKAAGRPEIAPPPSVSTQADERNLALGSEKLCSSEHFPILIHLRSRAPTFAVMHIQRPSKMW